MRIAAPRADPRGAAPSLDRVAAIAAWALVAVLVVRVVAGALLSDGFASLDDYSHLELSQLAAAHPTALLGVWGRPLMTGAYLPAVELGTAAVRFTSVAMLLATAALTAGVAVRTIDLPGRQHTVAPVAAMLVLAQPVAAQLGFAALPQTVFSLVLALSAWLWVRGRLVPALLAFSLLPLARIEGVVVLAVVAVVLIRRGELRALPLLATGLALWWLGATAAYRDPFFLLTHNPNGVLGSIYGRAGWTYGASVLAHSAGAVVAGLALAALAVARFRDRLVPAIGATLFVFYTLAWGLPAFNLGPGVVYPASLAVPLAVLATGTIAALVRGRGVVRPAGAVAAAVVVALAFAGSATSAANSALMLLVAGAAIATVAASAVPAAARTALAASAVVAACAIAVIQVTPFGFGGVPGLSHRLAVDLGPRTRAVAVWTEPTFGWWSHRSVDDLIRANSARAALAAAPLGGMVVRDSVLGPDVVSARRLEGLGYDRTRRLVDRDTGQWVELWTRTTVIK